MGLNGRMRGVVVLQLYVFVCCMGGARAQLPMACFTRWGNAVGVVLVHMEVGSRVTEVVLLVRRWPSLYGERLALRRSGSGHVEVIITCARQWLQVFCPELHGWRRRIQPVCLVRETICV